MKKNKGQNLLYYYDLDVKSSNEKSKVIKSKGNQNDYKYFQTVCPENVSSCRRKRKKHEKQTPQAKNSIELTENTDECEDESEKLNEENEYDFNERIKSFISDIPAVYGISFDQKILYVTLYLIGLVGPTIQLSFVVSIILLLLSQKIIDIYRKGRNSLIFTEKSQWTSWVLKHCGLADAILSWNFFLILIIQCSFQLLILSDMYVLAIHKITGESFHNENKCYLYSDETFKLFIFIILWFYFAVLITGQIHNHFKEASIASYITYVGVIIEVVSLLGFILFRQTNSTIDEVLDSYDNLSWSDTYYGISFSLIVLNSYWMDIPATLGATEDLEKSYNKIYVTHSSVIKNIVICIVIAIFLPLYIPASVFRILKKNCHQFWFIYFPFLPVRCILYLTRALHVISSLFTNLFISGRLLEYISNSGMTVSTFSIRNPLNKSPIVALIFVSVLIGILSCTLKINQLFNMQIINIIISRSLFSFTAILRKEYKRSLRRHKIILKKKYVITKVQSRLMNSFVLMVFCAFCISLSVIFIVGNVMLYVVEVFKFKIPIAILLLFVILILIILYYLFKMCFRMRTFYHTLDTGWVLCVLSFSIHILFSMFPYSLIDFIIVLVMHIFGLLLYFIQCIISIKDKQKERDILITKRQELAKHLQQTFNTPQKISCT